MGLADQIIPNVCSSALLVYASFAVTNINGIQDFKKCVNF